MTIEVELSAYGTEQQAWKTIDEFERKMRLHFPTAEIVLADIKDVEWRVVGSRPVNDGEK